ncbi:MAG: zinc ribbon domain-containing protein, partial [Candidatus Thermoplasmatota archaeon]
FFLFIGIILIIWMIVAKTMAYYYGQKLLPKPSTTTILYEYCTNCGKKIESSWNICGYCGKRLRG